MEVVKFYRQHHAEFPNEAIDNAYIDRIRNTYPVHPELFDRLSIRTGPHRNVSNAPGAY